MGQVDYMHIYYNLWPHRHPCTGQSKPIILKYRLTARLKVVISLQSESTITPRCRAALFQLFWNLPVWFFLRGKTILQLMISLPNQPEVMCCSKLLLSCSFGTKYGKLYLGKDGRLLTMFSLSTNVVHLPLLRLALCQTRRCSHFKLKSCQLRVSFFWMNVAN